MSDDWQVGDLALCVRNGPIVHPCGGISTGELLPPVGSVLRVESVVIPAWEGGPRAGESSGYTSLFLERGYVGDVSNFLKIRHDSEPCEAEFTTLIKRMKPAKVSS